MPERPKHGAKQGSKEWSVFEAASDPVPADPAAHPPNAKPGITAITITGVLHDENTQQHGVHEQQSRIMQAGAHVARVSRSGSARTPLEAVTAHWY